jgi:CBS domain-containing protein
LAPWLCDKGGFWIDIESILAGKGREVRTIMPHATIAEAVDRMRKEWIGALIVSEDGARIAGIISDRGIMNAIADHGSTWSTSGSTAR